MVMGGASWRVSVTVDAIYAAEGREFATPVAHQ
jgi:hypothetical protein